MTTIDHPLLEAQRVIESTFADREAIERARDEYHAGPATVARMRESVFEILGPGFRGCLPVAIEAVLDPATVQDSLGFARWLAMGPVDDASVLEMAGGEWFGVAKPGPDADRRMVGFVLAEESAAELETMLGEGRKPVWAVPAVECFDLGSEREYRAFMAEAEPPASDDGGAA